MRLPWGTMDPILLEISRLLDRAAALDKAQAQLVIQEHQWAMRTATAHKLLELLGQPLFVAYWERQGEVRVYFTEYDADHNAFYSYTGSLRYKPRTFYGCRELLKKIESHCGSSPVRKRYAG